MSASAGQSIAISRSTVVCCGPAVAGDPLGAATGWRWKEPEECSSPGHG